MSERIRSNIWQGEITRSSNVGEEKLLVIRERIRGYIYIYEPGACQMIIQRRVSSEKEQWCQDNEIQHIKTYSLPKDNISSSNTLNPIFLPHISQTRTKKEDILNAARLELASFTLLTMWPRASNVLPAVFFSPTHAGTTR